MVRRNYIFFVLLLGLFSPGFSQEYHFKLKINDRTEIDKLTDIISIDDFRDSLLFAYADEESYSQLLELGYFPQRVNIDTNKSVNFKMISEKSDSIDWNAYPTFPQYIAMMNNFAQQYPQICRIDTFGHSVLGRPLLAVKISDNVNIEEPEPRFLYSGQIHGDEILTYILLLRLIDYLLNNYQNDARIKHLINNTEIWINPLFNPDGTYHGQDTTVAGGTRYNANGVDLNRNFPDFYRGDHPDGKPYQPETMAMMDFAAEHHFILSANLHTGSEVLNYPWDTWSARAADNQWWQDVCRRYVDTVHVYGPAGYMRALNDGITNGYDWYSIHGGRQDYMNYFQHCREVTMELCYTKAVPDTQLSDYWNYNKNALLTYMEEILKGVRGVVRDKAGQPVSAGISIPGYDHDHSEVYSDSLHGDFYRMLLPGSYSFLIEAEGFAAKAIENIAVNDSAAVEMNVVLNRPPRIISFFPQRLDTVMLNKGYIFKTSVNDGDGDSLTYGFIHGENIVYDTTASFVFNNFGRDSVLFYVQDGSDTTYHLWSFDVPNITDIESDGIRAADFELKQNYPNPFNPLTQISYQIPAGKETLKYRVKLEVYNSLGQRVRAIVNDNQPAGVHSFVFKADGLSSGIYYYKISISGENGKTVYFSQAKKMIILK